MAAAPEPERTDGAGSRPIELTIREARAQRVQQALREHPEITTAYDLGQMPQFLRWRTDILACAVIDAGVLVDPTEYDHLRAHLDRLEGSSRIRAIATAGAPERGPVEHLNARAGLRDVIDHGGAA